MDMCFNVFEVLQIAEEVEHKAARFCLRAAERFADWDRRNVYYNLASWRAKHQQAWARIRQEYTEKTGEFGTFDPDSYVMSNPQVMAGLSCFGTEANSHGQPTGHETWAQIVRDAIRRSEGVVIFYRGLKEFACGPTCRAMIDNMIAEEDRYIRLLNRLLDRVRPLAERDASLAMAHAAGGEAVHAAAGWHSPEHN
jgi:rubrerythrin